MRGEEGREEGREGRRRGEEGRRGERQGRGVERKDRLRFSLAPIRLLITFSLLLFCGETLKNGVVARNDKVSSDRSEASG